MSDIVVIAPSLLIAGFGAYMRGGSEGAGVEPHPTLSGDPGGFGGIDPAIYTRAQSTCPPNRNCVPVGTNGIFVADAETGTIYFSDAGYDRAVNGANIDWPRVVRDLLVIVGGALGGMAPGVYGIVGSFIGYGTQLYDEWISSRQ